MAPQRPAGPDGVLLLDKPAGWTSHDVVARARRWCGTRKIGHAGTLDPMATGLLILGIGKGTRLLTWLTAADKGYSATVRLGSGTPSDDADSEPDRFADAAELQAVDEQRVDAALEALRGDIEQVPSTVSAIKIDGVRAYARARAGEAVDIPARRVTVSRLERGPLRRAADGQIDFELQVDCSSGTYIRAIARDLGAVLGVHGHLRRLRRDRIGGFRVEQALAVPGRDEEPSPPALIPLAEAAAATMPVRELTADEARALGYGQRVTASGVPGPVAAVLPCQGGRELVAVLEDQAGKAKPAVVFAPAS